MTPTLDLMGRWNPKGLFCSRDCTELYLLHTDPKRMRRHIFDRDLGCCAECGTKHPWGGKFEVDHERPLFLAFDDWDFYSADNQRLLCTEPCHKVKTAQDRTLMKPARVARRRARRKGLQP